MLSYSYLIQIFALIVCLSLSALFSGSETALFSLSRFRLKYLSEKGVKAAKVINSLVARPDRLLGTILVGNNIVNIAASAIGTSLALGFFPRSGVLIATIAMTLLILIFGEVTPKIYAARDREKVSFLVGPLLKDMGIVLSPFVNFLTIVSSFLVGRVDKKEKKTPFITEEELKMLVSLGEEEGVLEEEEREMIHGIFEFGDKTVKEVMTPRVDMEGVNLESDIDEIIDLIVEAGHSRVPVYRENIDNIVGIAYTRDLLNIWRHRELVKIQDLLRPPYFVPETKKLSELFREFKEKGLHIAIIVDEYGGTAGLVTMEDLLEEIVGEILDEYNRKERRIEPLGEGVFLVDARIDIGELNERLDLKLPQQSFETLGGYLTNLLGRVPEKGEGVEYQGLKIYIAEADRRRIIKIKIKKTKEERGKKDGRESK